MRHTACAAALVIVAAAAWTATPSWPPLDDGYIALDSAQSLLAGGDAQYGSPPLTGVTSPPFVLLITALLANRVPAVLALRIALALGLTALVAALWALARSAGLERWRRLLLPVAVLAAGPVVQQATNGVETGWAMAAATALIAAALADRPLAVAALAGILPWLRPGLSPLAGVMFVAAIWPHDRGVRIRAAAIAALIFLPWPLWVHHQTGHWIPQTMDAKAAFFAESCRPLADKAALAGRHILAWGGIFFPASALAIAWVPSSSKGRLALAASLVTLVVFALVLPGGLTHNGYRYLFPIGVPIVALGLARALQPRSVLVRITSLGVVGASLVMWPLQPWAGSKEGAERVAAATWVREHVDPLAPLLVHDAGAIAVFTTNPLIDLVGLKTPSSIAAHKKWTLPSCGAERDKAVASIAGASGAQYFVVTLDWDHFFSLTPALRDAGFTVRELRAPPLGEDGYKVFRIDRPSVGTAGTGDRAP